MKRIDFKNQNLQKSVYIFLIFTSFLWIILMGISVHYYPGGRIGDSTSEGFSFLYNPISDLGRVNGWNGEPNTVSRVLSIIAINIFSLALMSYYLVIWVHFQEKKVTRWLSLLGSITGVACSICYIILSYAAADTIYPLHKQLLTTFPIFFFLSVVLYLVVFFMKKDFPKINAYSLTTVTLAALALGIVVAIANNQGGEFDRIARRLGNTIFNMIQTIVFCILGFGAYIYIQRQNKIEIVRKNAKRQTT